jgi:hypothetical protein
MRVYKCYFKLINYSYINESHLIDLLNIIQKWFCLFHDIFHFLINISQLLINFSLELFNHRSDNFIINENSSLGLFIAHPHIKSQLLNNSFVLCRFGRRVGNWKPHLKWGRKESGIRKQSSKLTRVYRSCYLRYLEIWNSSTQGKWIQSLLLVNKLLFN